MIPKVALLIETARGYGRQLLRGIVRYSRLHGPWSFYITPGDFAQALPRMQQWGGAGIIARIETPAVARAILRAGLPTVALDLSDEQLAPGSPLARFSEVASDSRQAAARAAEHLLERQFRSYGFVGIDGRVWSERRQAAFRERIRAAGFEPHVYQPPRSVRDREWEREQAILADWLEALPRPAGLMACDDDRGRAVLEACRIAGIQVPESLAVVGVDNDELLCELADPPLSSVAINAEGAGYKAAALLDQMMRGKVRRPQRLLAEALGVEGRRSTDVVAVQDSEVAGALHFIHNLASESITVEDVVRHLSISRRALEMRFHRTVGRTLHAELERVRLERARRLLAATDLPIPAVAASSGYATASYFGQIFRRKLGVTPARYRRQSRGA